MKRIPCILALAAVVTWTPCGHLHAEESSSLAVTTATLEKPIKPSGKKPNVRLIKTSKPEATQSKQKVSLKGSLSKSTIQDADGKVLLSAAELKRPIYSIKISPSGQRAIIYTGDAYNQIYELEPFRAGQILPSELDVPRTCGLDKWAWIDDNTLVAISAIHPTDAELDKMGLTAAEKEVDRRERTLIYTYTLSTGELTEIDPSTINLPALFDVTETRAGGYLEVVKDGETLDKAIWVRVQKTGQ